MVPLLPALIGSAAGWLAAACSLHAADFYISPYARTNGTGTLTDPAPLARALFQSTSPSDPGDTLWLRGGVYSGGVTSYLFGTASQPITIRPYPGERAIIDGAATNVSALTIEGRWNIWRDVEVVNSSTNRALAESRPFGIWTVSTNTKLINCVVHDSGGGIGFWTGSVDAEMYGCLVYNSGYETTNKGNGHSVYTQNDAGTKWIHDNILCNSFGEGFSIYTETGYVRGFDLQGNVAFNAGASSISDHRFRNVLVGSQIYTPSRFKIVSNYTYTVLGLNSEGVNLTQFETIGEDMVFTDNVMVGGDIACLAGRWRTLDFQRNSIATTPAQTILKAGPFNLLTPGSTFDNNQYFGAGARSFVALEAEGNPLNFAAWQAFTGHDSNSVASPGQPAGTHVIVRPNKYQTRRAHLAIYNWDQLDRVAVSLNGVFVPGDAYEVRNAQDYFGSPVLTGIYTGSPVLVPTTNLHAAAPAGMARSNVRPDKTFNSFIVLEPNFVPATNRAPVIAGLVDQFTGIGTPTTPLPFGISDDQTPPESLHVDVTSSNPLLLPASQLTIGGSGHFRTLTLAPLPFQTGTATVTVAVSDGAFTTRQSFLLTVTDMSLPTVGLAAHWKFDENTGTNAADSAGANTGTLINGPLWVPGLFGPALQFGSANYVRVPDIAALRLQAPFSISLWFKPSVTLKDTSSRKDLLQKHSSYWLILNYPANDGRLTFALNQGLPRVKSSTKYWPAGQWQHAACVADGTNLHIYVNGVLEGTAPGAAPVAVNNIGLLIGGLSTQAYFPGVIDQARLYRTNLSTAAVLALHRETNPSVPPLIARLQPGPGAGQATLVWQSAAGTSYLIEYKIRLDDLEWLPHSGPIVATSALTLIPVNVTGEALFYRVLANP